MKQKTNTRSIEGTWTGSIVPITPLCTNDNCEFTSCNYCQLLVQDIKKLISDIEITMRMPFTGRSDRAVYKIVKEELENILSKNETKRGR